MYAEINAGALSETSTDRRYRLGEVRAELNKTYGTRLWRYVKNGSASALTAGLGAMLKDSQTQDIVELSGAATPKCRMRGVAQHTLAAVSGSTYTYGWVLAKGIGYIQSNGTQSINTAQKTAAAGQFTDGVIGTDELPAFAIGDDGGVAGTNVLGLIDCL